MDKRNKWKSPQAIIVMAIILLIFVYIGIDMAKTKPEIRSNLNEVKAEYIELTEYLDRKLPEIESTLEVQGMELSNQGAQIDSLNQTVKKIIRE